MALSNEQLIRAKKILREDDCPFFDDDDLNFYYSENGNNFNNMLYNCFITKAENTALNVSGLSCSDTSKYFLRLAQKYKQNNSGILKGGI